jgi:hypothetical protein
MQPCFPERAFCYWRRGLYGHVVRLCETGSAAKSASVFLNLYRGIAHTKLGEAEPALTYLSPFRQRTDLLLVFQMTRYVLFCSAPSASCDLLSEVRADVIGTIPGSNTLSLYYSAKVAWFFGERALLRQILAAAPADNWLIKLLTGWIDLSDGLPTRAIASFTQVLDDRVHSSDCLTLYGLATAQAAAGETSACVQTIARVLSRHDFPELNMAKAELYLSARK